MVCVRDPNPDNLPPCHRRPGFTQPIPGTPDTEAALKLCQTCPRRVMCAREALSAGDSLDGHVKRPAADGIQAGIHCHGDQLTAWRLSRVAGVDMPTVSDTTPRNSPPPYCRSCQSVMVGWTRDEVPKGRVMHYGRGYCVNCRPAYKAAVAAGEDNMPTLYDGGRIRLHRRAAPQSPPNPEPEQLSLL